MRNEKYFALFFFVCKQEKTLDFMRFGEYYRGRVVESGAYNHKSGTKWWISG